MNLSEIKRKAAERKLGNIDCILYSAIILHVGWEMDNEAWLCAMKDGSVQLFSTNHGGLCKMPLDELREAKEEAQASVDGIDAILRALDKL